MVVMCLIKEFSVRIPGAVSMLLLVLWLPPTVQKHTCQVIFLSLLSVHRRVKFCFSLHLSFAIGWLPAYPSILSGDSDITKL